ncbi:MAG TPA: DUF2087 domain-containing protein [Acidimicrobiales bacterium]|nr:DUF2087 domain-containing protein [Acidimicrobiales bacterium]
MTDAGPEALVGLLAEESRLKVMAAVVLGATTESAIAGATGLDARCIRKALDRLVRGGVVEAAGEGVLRVATDRFKDAAQQAAARRKRIRPEDLGATADQAGVLRNYLVDGKLTHIPAQRSKRLIVLDFLSGQFEPGRTYPEEQVNYLLGRFHPDYAALRRDLVEEEFLERREGFYWRTGGTVLVDERSS